MPKYCDVSPETKEFIEQKLSDAELDNYIDTIIIADDAQKDVYKVQKCTALLEHLTSCQVIITMNDDIFFDLPPEYQEIVIDEALAHIYYNDEKDKVVITKPDVNSYSLLLKKYTFDEYMVMVESVKSLYDNKKNQES
jgi:hypothetical protein